MIPAIAATWEQAESRNRRAVMLSAFGIGIILYSIIIYGELLTGTAAHWFTDMALTLFPLLACVKCLQTARRQTQTDNKRAWAFFSAAACLPFLGMLYWDYLELAREQYTPYPTLADYFFSGFAPLFIVGTFFYRREAPTIQFALKQIGNVGVILCGLVVMFIFMLLEPIESAGKSAEFLIFSIIQAAIPSTAFIFALLSLGLYLRGRLRTIFLLMVLAIGLHAAGNILYGYMQLESTFGAGNYLNLYWLIAFALQYWAAFEQDELHRRGDEQLSAAPSRERPREIEAIIPAVLMLSVMIVAYGFEANVNRRTLEIISPFVLVFLLFLGLREWWADRLVGKLIQQLRDSTQTLVHLNDELEKGIEERTAEILERKRTEEALFAEKERIQVTLHSIGDAVITTNAIGTVDYLNPVAEALTGWPLAEARGKPLDTVFRIIAEESGEPAPDLIARCLKEGQVVGVGNHTLLINRDGRQYSIEDSAAPIYGSDGKALGVVLVFRDVTEVRRITKQMEYDASHDPLTGLINRREFEQRLEHALTSTKTYRTRHALCYLDLDQFKIVNDTAGHAAGDELLKQIKGLLAGKFRERDTLARLGGDEFGLLLENCPLKKAREVADAIVTSIRDYRFAWQGRTFQIGVSIGLVPITAQAENTAQLLSQADVACHIAKDLGRNRVHLYQREGSAPDLGHREILRAAGLRDALEQNWFRLYYQPIVPLSGNSTAPTRYEILLRLLDDDGELLLPGAFIPAAERYGLMGAIDRWVIRTVFHRYAASFNLYQGATIAINLSGNSLNDASLLDFVREQFVSSGIPPSHVCFEITETATIHNLSQAGHFIKGIRELGSRLALDDFGSGLSSFSYLKTLPVDYLKIDGSFVRDMIENSVDHAMVSAINQMGHIMGVKTVAEYAHSTAIVERLKELGVDYAQGYALGSPMPLDDIGQEPRSAAEVH